MISLSKKNKIILSIILAVVISVSCMAGLISQAEDVVILEETNPELTLQKVHTVTESSKAIGAWEDITGSFSQNGSKYSLKSNGFTQWYDGDSLHFAYKKVIFNYGKVATLTAETTMTVWNPKSVEGGAGLMIRSSLDPGAATIMLHTRPSCIFVTYRSADGQMALRGSKADFKPTYPIQFKMVLNKNKVQCFYKRPQDKTWMKLGAVPFVYGPSVYIGLSAYSQQENDIAESVYDGFHYQIEAPEGTEVSTDETASGPANTEEEEIILPEDLPVSEDTLLSETFTDGSMTEGEASVTNPIWFTKNVAIEVLTNEEKNNRYLSEVFTDAYYHAGDEHWTDYETSAEFTFTDDYSMDEANRVDLYTRLTSVAQYGYHSYFVRFTGGDKVQLGYLEGGTFAKASNGSTNETIVDTYEYSYLDKSVLNKPINLRVRTFDNKVNVFLDDGSGEKEILSFVDETENVKSMGKIGVSANGAAVKIDNIKVVKLDDMLGGDYDNKISGNWDIETPDYIKEFINNEFSY